MATIPTLTAPSAAPPAVLPVPYEVWLQADLRIGQVLYASPVAGSHENLCQVTVDVGDWGIGTAMSKLPSIDPATLPGVLVVVACNIEPRTIAGIVATVLLVTVRSFDRKHSRLIVPSSPIEPGCQVG